MEAQTVTWLVFLALIKHVSTSNPKNPFKLESGWLLATEGSCSEIKCQVTEDVDDHDANWFWMKDRRWVESDKDFTSTVIYSTNTWTRPVSPDFANRVKYIGSSSSSWRNSYSAWPKPLCSILICDLRRSDSGKYSLRLVGRKQWLSEEVTLNVTVNRCPLTFEGPAVVVESDEVTLTCSTSSSCPSNPHIQDVTQIDRTQATDFHQVKERTTFSFRASREDDGRVFSCQTQDNTDKYLIQNITVTVKYSPKHVTVQANPGLDVKENVLLTLSCTAESNPPVSSVTWRKTTDGREEIVQQTRTQTFRVNSASPSDSGLYSCEATNDIGSGKSQRAEVKVRYRPTEPILSMRSEVTEGQTITVSCTVESFPQSTLTLTRTNTNNQALIITENNLYSRPNNSLSHKINVTSADAGLYFCRAQNSEGSKDSKQKELVVKYSPKHVTVQANSGFDVKENVSLTLSCTAESNPPVSSVTWRKKTDVREEIVQQTQTQTFRVNSASPSDSGLYSCEATNDIGSGKSQRAEVKVRYPLTEPILSMRSEVTEGQTITVNCTVESFPPSTITLARTYPYPQSFIITENKLNSRPINSLSHTFTVTSANAGLYVCRAQNSEVSKDSKKKWLVVKYPPTEPLLFMRSEVTEGQTITVNCTVESFPQSTLTLMRINTNHQSLKITENNLYSRPINSLYHKINVTSADAGWYFCRAQNSEGSKDSKQNELVVKYPPTEPILSMRSEVTEGQTITVTCTVESFPQSTLTLMRINTNPQSLKITENNLYSRPINSLYHKINVTSADAGWYVCRAQNSEGSKDSKQKKLVVKYPPTEPILSMSSEVTEGQTITVSCTVESFPQSNLTLMRINTNPQSLKITENNLYSRPINSLYHKINVTSADAGLYVCRAQNSEGSKDSKQKKLVVKFAPKHTNITKSSEKQELDGRSSVMLSCISHSFPPVQHYSWYRKSQGEEKDEIVSEHQNHTVYSNQSGVYYCVAENEVDQSLSDPVRLFERNYLHILKFLVPALFVLMIIILTIVVLRYRRKKSIQQGTTTTESPSGFSNEPESLQDYENISNATARAPTSPNLFDNHTSEGEVELHYSQVRFTATPRR
ncbi:B-cell receptor CD22 isoform X3 [Hippoglossus stenolepis]|uniref:B-cell receptor CD22 isoform X3 n=1 Tax=Hippoglossus stenolepis TaxID=195615 RepID=UPI001FAF4721|nr:B-cell receptor CD22 isoform X3 [Hippoglossus stenolepis]XP_047196709.1 B-cell receptor CD22 isoform X3 [Hippoglossus stenolepis]